MNAPGERPCWIRDFRNTITKSSRGKGFKTARRAVARKIAEQRLLKAMEKRNEFGEIERRIENE